MTIVGQEEILYAMTIEVRGKYMTVITTKLTWEEVIGHEKAKPYFNNTLSLIKQERANGRIIYPEHTDIFNAFKLTKFNKLKVVILGQDPYHGPNQAHGLCFSVKKGVALPPSLKNIYKEINNDLGIQMPNSGDLTAWAKQGVLLLNTVLTVRANEPASHANIGWETFTDAVIDAINTHNNNVVFLLWGSYAKNKCKHIDTSKHLVLSAPHPSPLSAHRGFFGCQHFSKANAALESWGKEKISWQLD